MTSPSSQLPTIEPKCAELNALTSEAVDFETIASQPNNPPHLESKARIILAPDRETQPIGKTVFLSGTVASDNGTHWQDTVIERLKDLPITIYNPRRSDWDSSWTEDISYFPFCDQVSWELKALEEVDVIMLYLAPSSASPVSLLELGTFAHSKRMVVGCPEGYFKRGNVQIICQRYGIDLVDSFEALMEVTRERLLALAREEQLETKSMP